MLSFSSFEKIYEKAKHECKLRKISVFNINFQKISGRQPHQNNEQSCLARDLYRLWIGLRDVVLLDYVMLRESDCENFDKLSCELENNYSDQDGIYGSIGIMKIKFFMFFDGKREEMIFNYLINIERLTSRLEKLASTNANELIFVDIDALDRKEPHLESGEKISNNVLPFVHLISEKVIENIKLNKRVFEIDFYKHLNPSQPFIPFDATLMNGILLNYPIILFYGSRFPLSNSTSVKSKFYANHVLNNIDLYRYNLKLEQDTLLQFVLPLSIHSENSQSIDSTLEMWLNHLNKEIATPPDQDHQPHQLELTRESIQYDNIVL